MVFALIFAYINNSYCFEEVEFACIIHLALDVTNYCDHMVPKPTYRRPHLQSEVDISDQKSHLQLEVSPLITGITFNGR